MAYVNYYLTQRVKITLPNIAACGRGGDKRKSLLKAGVFQPVEKASNSLAFSNNLWYNIPGDEKC